MTMFDGFHYCWDSQRGAIDIAFHIDISKDILLIRLDDANFCQSWWPGHFGKSFRDFDDYLTSEQIIDVTDKTKEERKAILYDKLKTMYTTF